MPSPCGVSSFDDYDRLAVVPETDGKGQPAMRDGSNAARPSYHDWRRMQTAFDGLAGIEEQGQRMRNEFNEPITARGLRVSAEFFAVLRVAPLIGRPFGASDEVVGQHHVAILSYGLWQRQFAGAPDAVGRTIQIMTFNRLTGGSSYEPWQIVGVMPRHFTYPLGRVRETEVYIPLASSDVERSRWTGVAGGGRFGSGYEVIGACGRACRSRRPPSA